LEFNAVRERTISAKVKTRPSQKTADKADVKAKEPTAKAPKFQVPFTKKNYMAFLAGFVVLGIGYLCLAQPPVNGFLSLTLAPILLVLGYCVIFPYAILARDKPKHATAAPKGD
jgi:hypothetical protein